jgi:hypothetical protein
MARMYALVVGAVLLVIGVLGFLTNSLMAMEFHPAHNVIHLLPGILGLWAGSRGDKLSRSYAQIFGAVYTLVAVAGFAGIHDLGSIKLGLNSTYSVVHLLVGLAGLAAGFSGRGHEAERSKAAGA